MIIFNRTLSKEYIIKNKATFEEKFEHLNKLALEHGYNLYDLISFKKEKLATLLSKGNAKVIHRLVRRTCRFFLIDHKYLLNANHPLPSDESIQFDFTVIKLRTFNDFLVNEKGISLARAISMSEDRMTSILNADRKVKKSTLKKIAEYFLMPYKQLLTTDPLPKDEPLVVDEDLLKIQIKDLDDRIHFFKNKHYIRKNYRILSRSKRFQLIITTLFMMLPLVAYTGYCALIIGNERLDTVEKYKQGSDESVIYDKYDETQEKYYQNLMTTDKSNDPDSFYVDVTVGSKLYVISSISYSTNSYVTRMELYFKFDKAEFETMFKHYAVNVLNNLIIKEYEEQNPNDLKSDEETNSHWISEHDAFVNRWVKEHSEEYYPGETPSNVLTDKQTMFDIGNGGFVADSYGTVKELEEIEYVDEDGVNRILCYQKVKFEARFEKAFDSYRYPLDSIQLKMYIQPTLDATYMRYIPDRSENSYGERVSGFASYFKIGNGYRLIKETDEISNFTQKINYYCDTNNDPATANEYPHTYKTQLEVIVRANRQGISLFLQAFVNLFSVTIWICIAFYNQSYNGEDSIGMLGTGLFGAISSVLVGISMVSDAGLFSLITMINIFTLGVILIMTYQSITARRAIVKQDKNQIAYNGVKLRISFFVLLITTAIMFVGLPLLSYIFAL